MQEGTPIVDDDLLEVITLAAKSCSVTAQLNISEDIDIVRRVMSRLVTTSLHESTTPSQHSVEGPTSLEVDAGILSSVDSPIASPGVTGEQSPSLLLSLLLLFVQDPTLRVLSRLQYR